MTAGLRVDKEPRGRWTALLLVVEWALLLAALGTFTITEEYRPYVVWGLVELAASFAVRWVRTGHPIRRTGLDVPWALFVASAGIAAWVAYDRPEALLKLSRILAATVLYYALVDSNERVLRWVAAGFVLAATGLALYWPTQHDFTAMPGRLAVITTIGQWINAHVPRLPGPSIQWNIAGGVLVLALPFAIALTGRFWRERWRAAAIVGGALSVILAGCLFLTGNRGGWLSVAVAAGLVGLAWAQRRWFPGNWKMALFWGVVAALAVVVGAGIVVTGNLDRLLGLVPGPTGTLQGRLQLWDQGLALIRDYAFTGCGLNTFPMVYSTYGILIHTPVLAHVHNTFLEVWIEQGLLGALALVWGGAVVLAGAWRALRSDRVSYLGWAGLAALAMVAVHGAFDAALYGARTLPLMGIAVGYAWLGVRSASVSTWNLKPGTRRVLAAALVALVLLVALIFHRALLSAWHANLGAVAQAQVELAIYDPVHFDNPTMDRIRQTADLSAAERDFARALEWDGGTVTARQRLGAIALSRGGYEQGLAQLQAAWDAGHRDAGTRLLLGDGLVATGQIEEAVETVRGLPWAEMRLRGQAWYRYWVNEDYRRAADAWAVVLMLNPGAMDVVYWQKEAEKRAQ